LGLNRGTEYVIKQTGYWLSAANALLGKLLREAVGAERLLIARSELLPDQHLLTPGTRETFTMPRGALVRYSALVDHLLRQNDNKTFKQSRSMSV